MLEIMQGSAAETIGQTCSGIIIKLGSKELMELKKVLLHNCFHKTLAPDSYGMEAVREKLL